MVEDPAFRKMLAMQRRRAEESTARLFVIRAEVADKERIAAAHRAFGAGIEEAPRKGCAG